MLLSSNVTLNIYICIYFSYMRSFEIRLFCFSRVRVTLIIPQFDPETQTRIIGCEIVHAWSQQQLISSRHRPKIDVLFYVVIPGLAKRLQYILQKIASLRMRFLTRAQDDFVLRTFENLVQTLIVDSIGMFIWHLHSQNTFL